MLSYNDSRRANLKGGYHAFYDPRPALQKLATGKARDVVWKELWNELHHQGDVDDASYASVPQIVRIYRSEPDFDWNFYAFVSIIEIERHRKKNPPLPDWLAGDYFEAWSDLLKLAIRAIAITEQPIEIRSILGAIALAKGNIKLGILISYLDGSELDEILEDSVAWSKLYEDK